MNSLLALMGTTGAASSTAQTGSMATSIITFGLIIVIIYFLIIRPQKKRDKEAKDMISSIAKGDKIVTIGGIHGTVVAVREQTVVIKVDDNTRMEFSKSAVSSVVAKKGAAKASTKNKAKSKNANKATEEKKVEAIEETPAETDDSAEKSTKEEK
ncbi:MAG: preprotein translocase subunit YajC [Pleomorphochaeta sp.]|jgi:preprotein translocase subunit YajC